MWVTPHGHQCPECEHLWSCDERSCSGRLLILDRRCWGYGAPYPIPTGIGKDEVFGGYAGNHAGDALEGSDPSAETPENGSPGQEMDDSDVVS